MSFSKGAEAVLCALLDALAPPHCIACEAETAHRFDYCGSCGTPEPLLDVACHVEQVPVFAGARYAEPLVSALHRFKYQAIAELCRPLSVLCRPGIDLLGIEPSDVWVPVPLHPLRLAERGYNQAALLARELAHSAGGSLDARRLRRVRHTEQQAKCDVRDRAGNVRGAFRARTQRERREQRIVLVDDVVTSGATLAACVRALRERGAQVVGCVAVAYASATHPL